MAADDIELREKLKALLEKERELREALEEFYASVADDANFFDSLDQATGRAYPLEQWSTLLRELRRPARREIPEIDEDVLGTDINQCFYRR